jgi:hypothetical protein
MAEGQQGRPTGSGTAKAAGWRRSGCWPGGGEGWSSCRCRPGQPPPDPRRCRRPRRGRAGVCGARPWREPVGGVPLARRIRRSRWTGWSCTRDPYSRSLAVAGHDPEPLTMPDHRGPQTTGPLVGSCSAASARTIGPARVGGAGSARSAATSKVGRRAGVVPSTPLDAVAALNIGPLPLAPGWAICWRALSLVMARSLIVGMARDPWLGAGHDGGQGGSGRGDDVVAGR